MNTNYMNFWGGLFVSFLLIESAILKLSAQEFAVVASEHGYVVNEKDEVLYKVPYFSIVEFKDVKDNKLILKSTSGEKGIRLGQIFPILELNEKRIGRPFSANDQQVMKDALVGLRDAFTLAGKQKYTEAIKKGEKAATTLELLFFSDPTPSPYEVWFQSHVAYFEYAADKFEAANKRLDAAEAMLKRIKTKDPIQAADLYNVRGLVRMAEGKYNESIPLFQKSLAITEKTLGKNHINRADFYYHISFAQEQLGQFQLALDAQNEALKLKLALLPDEAVELPKGYSRLGDLYLALNKPKQALSAYVYATRSFIPNHLNDFPNDIANSRIGQSDALKAMKNYDLAKKALEVGMDIELVAMRGRDEIEFKKAFLYRIGLLDYDQEKYDESLPYFERARKLYDRKDEEPTDAMIISAIGHVHAYNSRNTKAKSAYQEALQIYLRTEGEESANAKEVKQWITGLGN